MKRLLVFYIILSATFLHVSCMAKEPNMNESIISAVENKNIEAVKKLLDQGISVETRDSENRTILMIATYQNDLEMASLLMSYQANPNAQDRINNSPFLYAGASGYLDLVQLFLPQADFTVFNRYHGTALIPAAEKGHIEVVRLLSATAGFPINHVNRLGWTALMEAVVLGSGGKEHIEIISILLQAGADRHIPDADGVSALEHAKKRGFTEIVNLLSE